MEPAIPDKPYFRIGEVSQILGLQPYVIRYWESEFRSVRPERTSTDQRVYRRKDVEQLLLIRKLLYQDKYTISGAKKQLRKLRGEPAGGNEQERLIALKKGLIEIRELIR